MKAFIKLLLLALLFFGCHFSKNKDRNQLLTFDLKELPRVSNVKLTDLGFSDIQYIPLETNSKCLIQRKINLNSLRDRLIVGPDFFITKQFNSILEFNFNGTFIARIGTMGRGPDEFQTCHDIDIGKNEKIYLMDGWKRKFFVYNGNGELLKTISIPIYGFGDFRVADGNFLCYTDNHLGDIEYSYSLLDTSGRIVKKFPNKYPFVKYKNDAYGFYHENLFYSISNRLYKKEVYSDTIYLYENMNFKPHLVIDMGDKLITPKARSEFAGMDLAKNYISPQNLFEFGDYIYYEFTYKFDFANSEIYGFIGSKQTDFQALINPEKGLINDLDGGPNILPLTVKDDNTIIGWVEALELKKHVASETFKNSLPKYPEKKKELEQLANRLKDTDNPVLVLVRLKK